MLRKIIESPVSETNYSLEDYLPEEGHGDISTMNPETYWLLMEEYDEQADIQG